MKTPTPSPLPNDDGIRYERVDALTVNIYVEGPGERTLRPVHPAVKKILERDRDQIAALIARTRCEQEKLNARSSPPARSDESP